MGYNNLKHNGDHGELEFGNGIISLQITDFNSKSQFGKPLWLETNIKIFADWQCGKGPFLNYINIIFKKIHYHSKLSNNAKLQIYRCTR